MINHSKLTVTISLSSLLFQMPYIYIAG
jgi:hypothetical protein